MNSTKHLLHLINDPNISNDDRALARCQLAKQQEEIGNYESAREVMGELWSTPLDVLNLGQSAHAEVLLRRGTLTGWLANTTQTEGTQQAAKDLLSQSLRIFECLHDEKKVAETQIEIAVCYRREGAYNDARIWINQALTRLDDSDGDLKAVALMRSALIEQLAARFNDALNILRSAAFLFEQSTNHTLKGRFHNEFGLVLRNLGTNENRSDYIDQALLEYAAASFHFQQAGHSRYQACVENNLGFLFGTLRKFEEAHQHLDRAQALFTRLKDNVHLAQVEDARARIMLAEGNLTRAAQIAKNSVRMLETGDSPSLLAESLLTYGTAIARLGDQRQGRAIFERAIALTEHAGDLETSGIAALTEFEELAEHLSNNEMCELLQRAYDVLRETKHPGTRNRLTDCAYRALSRFHSVRPDWRTFSLDQSVHRHKAHYIQMALEDASGNISQAARFLGMRRNTNLSYLLKGPFKDIPRTAASELDTDDKVQTVKILHVEDDSTIAELVQDLAPQEGWDVKHCADGTEGLQELTSVAHYDLLLVDNELPGLHGLELIAHVRRLVHRRSLPIIVMSGTLDERTARDAGAEEFLRKPEDIGLLAETIDRLLDPDRPQQP